MNELGLAFSMGHSDHDVARVPDVANNTIVFKNAIKFTKIFGLKYANQQRR